MSKRFPWASALLIGPLAILAVLVVVLLFATAPGAWLLSAHDCLSDGRCTFSVGRYARQGSAHFVGAMAYILGTLLLVLASLASFLATKGIADFVRWIRGGREVEFRMSPAMITGTIVYLVVDTVLVHVLARWIDGR
jgi:hypothetical protein